MNRRLRFFWTGAWTGALIALAFAAGYLVHRRSSTASAPNGESRRVLYYVDPMHPAYRSDRPGVAPDCGMTLVPVYEDQVAGPAVVAQNRVRISAEQRQLIGIRTSTVLRDSPVRTIRSSGTVAIDETRVVRVHSRIEGWIDRVFANFDGKFVTAGEPLLTFYSPEVLASQNELLLAARGRRMLDASTMPGVSSRMEDLVGAARRRLQLFGMEDREIDQVSSTGEVLEQITLRSPATGYVMTRSAFPGQRIEPQTELYAIVDLSRVWILANAFEYELSGLTPGIEAAVTLPYGGSRPFRAQVTYLQPQVDTSTRSIRLRLEASNPGLRLKPDMYVDVEFNIPLPPSLLVPTEAVLDSGDQQIVFVDLGNGEFETRPVKIGVTAGDRTVVLSGLSEGERVVVSGQFLIDSESRLKSGLGAPPAHLHDLPDTSGTLPKPPVSSGGSSTSRHP